MRKQLVYLFLAALVLSSFYEARPAEAQLSAVRTIIFPVIGSVNYYDDFGNPRGTDRSHEGNDIFGRKMQPLVAAVDGVISNVNYPEASWGYSVTIRDSEGFTYHYLHMNNDTPGTDDGRGDGINAYAVEIQEGNRVVKGQLIGYMGDSGNAETTPPHLHFEIRQPNRQAFSPYQSLQNATRITAPVAAPKQDGEILPFEEFSGGAAVAAANFDRDDEFEIVTGAGPGGGPLVKVFDNNGSQLAAFYAYDPGFRGGIDVAAADIDNDGRAEIITAPGPGGGPHIKIFKLDGTVVREFFAYDPSFRGGVFISAADTQNNGKADIITGAGPGGGPHVKVFSADGLEKFSFFAYDPGFRGGVDVAAIPHERATGSSRSSGSSSATGGFVTAPFSAGGPHVKVYSQSGLLEHEFLAYEGDFNLGLRVAAGNANTSESGVEIGVIPARSGGPHAKLFSRRGTQVYSNLLGFEPWWRGGYDLALYNGGGVLSSFGDRRASVREVSFSGSERRGRNRN